MPLSYNYDKHDRRDILRHAKALEGFAVGDVYELELHGKQRNKILEYYAEKCIQGWMDVDGTAHRGDKGRIGFLVQEVYFDEPRDNEAQADLGNVGVELKVSPLIYKTRAGLKVKERLVLGMINRNEHLPKNFSDSHIYEKCKLMMLVYYIDETNQGRTPFQFPFHKSAYVKIPEVDMAMIEQDYRYIRDCVNEGRYEDLHESEAHYLSPCTKNGGRAFSFKPSYMNQLFSEYIDANNLLYDPENDEETFDIIRQYDAIVSDVNELREHTFEEIDISHLPDNLTPREIETIHVGAKVRENLATKLHTLPKEILISVVRLGKYNLVFAPNELFSYYIKAINKEHSVLIGYSNGYRPYVSGIEDNFITYETFTDTLTKETKQNYFNLLKKYGE